MAVRQKAVLAPGVKFKFRDGPTEKPSRGEFRGSSGDARLNSEAEVRIGMGRGPSYDLRRWTRPARNRAWEEDYHYVGSTLSTNLPK